ncbi:MAG: glycine cleavage system protein GcvH [Waddliaceae bacterium]
MKFTDTHEWVANEGDAAIIGITDHAQDELGEIVYVELPEVGKHIEAGEELAVLESTKAAADVYAPVSGEVIEVNAALEDNPELINNSAQENGWICKLKLTNPEEMDELLDAEAYKQILS